MADIGVRARSDKLVFGEESEVKGEEGPEGAGAGEAEEGACCDEGKTGVERNSRADGGRGGWAEDCGEGGGEGGAREVLGEDEGDVCEGAEPDERLLDLDGARMSMGRGRRRERMRGWEGVTEAGDGGAHESRAWKRRQTLKMRGAILIQADSVESMRALEGVELGGVLASW